MNPELKTSLQFQELCPVCGADWRVIEDSLGESLVSENFQNANNILKNCKVCMARFENRYNYLWD